MMTRNARKTLVPAAIAVASLALAALSVQPAAAQVAVPVPQAALDPVLASCASPVACARAMDALVAQLVAANPGIDIATVLGSIVAAVAAAYNAGNVPAAAATAALGAVSSVAAARGATEVVTAVALASAAVEAGDPIDTEAVAEASASPT
ncbi:MAG: hypothetical protein RIR62_2309 [Pseudomonadota bacterium]|jgi:hypothetical protein